MDLEPDTIVQVLLRERLRVTALAAAVIRDVHAADDIFQQVVLAALEAAPRVKDTDHVLAGSFRAARHRALDLARSRRLQSLPEEVLDLLESRWVDASLVSETDRGEALHRCIGRLGSPARELLQMKYVDGLSANTIADRQRKTAGAIYQNLCRIHRALRECVERDMAERGVANTRGVQS
jgi:RNA polymerase sigma-70 factor (ECF subfamily)